MAGDRVQDRKDMLAPNPVAGVDVGKSFLDLGFDPAAKALRVRNDAPGVAALIEALRRRGATRVALEAIGPYAWPLTAALVAAGFEVGLADPRQVRAFRTAEGGIAKTDRLDAGLIARFARTMPERLRPAPEPEEIALKALSTRRRQLTELIAMEKTRLAQAFDAEIAASHRTVIAALEAACAEVERRLEAAIAADPALARKREILTSIPGIAGRIAGVVIADMPELGNLDRKAAASLAGLAPHPDQSGALPGRHAIAGGRPCLRTAFYMAGMVAARCDPRFKSAYRAMRDAGKPPKVAIVATGRRLVTIANALIRENKTFDRSRFVS
jgi:transposase